MNGRIRLSVIIPVYNAEFSVSDTVGSVLAQDCQKVEIILVNDGSTDGSGEVCDRLAVAHDCIHVVHKLNGGVSSARNAGLAVAKGEYVMFLDADDLLKKDALNKMTACHADLVIGGFEKVVGGKVTESYRPAASVHYSSKEGMTRFFDDNIDRNNCYLLNSSCFKMFRKELITSNTLRFDEDIRYGEDKLFVFGYLRYVSDVSTVSEPVYEYIIQDESLSSDVSSDAHIAQILTLMSRYDVLLRELTALYPASRRLGRLYHADMISRYAFRILTCFALKKSSYLRLDTLSLLYSYMSEDKDLSLGSVRAGQVVNYLLYRIGSPRFSMAFYSFISSMLRYISFR